MTLMLHQFEFSHPTSIIISPIRLDKVPTSPNNPTMEKKLHKPAQPPESIPGTKRHDQALALLLSGLMVAVQATAQPVTSVSAGYGHSLFLKSDGSLWAMGRNDWGQLGDGTQPPPYFVNRPEQILSTVVTAVDAGITHTLFIKSDGSLWATGYNPDGQLGDGTFNNTNRP